MRKFFGYIFNIASINEIVSFFFLLVCGGAVHSQGYELMSPNFPSQYDNNQECEWEIQSAEGTHIGLTFVDRFHIESSDNCKNDFVKVKSLHALTFLNPTFYLHLQLIS